MSDIRKYIRTVEFASGDDDDGWDDDDDGLFTYGIWYRLPHMKKYEHPLVFQCQAENEEHAREQCLDAEPEATIVRVEKLEEY